MKIVNKLDKPITETVEIFCNLCGLSCKSPMGEFYGLIEQEVVGGFESTHLGDADVHKFSLCEACCAAMISQFKYPSFQGNYLFPEEKSELLYAEDFDPAKYQGEFLSSNEDSEEVVNKIESKLKKEDLN